MEESQEPGCILVSYNLVEWYKIYLLAYVEILIPLHNNLLRGKTDLHSFISETVVGRNPQQMKGMEGDQRKKDCIEYYTRINSFQFCKPKWVWHAPKGRRIDQSICQT